MAIRYSQYSCGCVLLIFQQGPCKRTEARVGAPAFFERRFLKYISRFKERTMLYHRMTEQLFKRIAGLALLCTPTSLLIAEIDAGSGFFAYNSSQPGDRCYIVICKRHNGGWFVRYR